MSDKKFSIKDVIRERKLTTNYTDKYNRLNDRLYYQVENIRRKYKNICDFSNEALTIDDEVVEVYFEFVDKFFDLKSNWCLDTKKTEKFIKESAKYEKFFDEKMKRLDAERRREKSNVKGSIIMVKEDDFDKPRIKVLRKNNKS